MNRKYIIFLLLTALLYNCTSQKIVSSKWQEKTVDTLSNIPRTAYNYHSENKIFYLISNDDDQLYIHLKVDDQNVQKRLLMSGFTIWIDSSAKSGTYMGLSYQVDPNKMLMKPQELQKYLPLDEEGKKMDLSSYLLKHTLQQTIGFHFQNDDIKYQFENDNEKSLNFQVVLPIKYFSNALNSDPVISVILESKAPVSRIQRPQGQSPQMGMSMQGGRPGGSGGGGRGGGGGGGKSAGTGDRMKDGNRNTSVQGMKDIKIEVKKLQLSQHE